MKQQCNGWSLRKLLCAVLIAGPLVALPAASWAKDNAAKNMADTSAIIANGHINVANAIQTTSQFATANPASANLENGIGSTTINAAFTLTAFKEGGAAVSAAEIVLNSENTVANNNDPGTNVALANATTGNITVKFDTAATLTNNGPNVGSANQSTNSITAINTVGLGSKEVPCPEIA